MRHASMYSNRKDFNQIFVLTLDSRLSSDLAGLRLAAWFFVMTALNGSHAKETCTLRTVPIEGIKGDLFLHFCTPILVTPKYDFYLLPLTSFPRCKSDRQPAHRHRGPRSRVFKDKTTSVTFVGFVQTNGSTMKTVLATRNVAIPDGGTFFG